MKWDKLVPISNQEPVFLIKNKKLKSIMSEKSIIIEKALLICMSRYKFMARNTQVTINIGTVILIKINTIIVNGLKTVVKLRTHIGSNELRLAILPVPKKDINTNPNCKIS